MKKVTNGFFVLVLGLGTVFVGLVSLILITKLMSALVQAAQGKKKDVSKAADLPAAPIAAPVSPREIPNRPQFVAAISAAIATAMNTDVSGLRIHSIRPLSGQPAAGSGEDRSRFVAAVAASIAAYTGTEASGLRIHSIKKI